MSDFEIDARLLADTSVLMQTADVSYLLHNNAEVLWFILVPHTDHIEFYQLTTDQQLDLCKRINRVCEMINNNHPCDKINVATIGNMVSQMHIHIVARRKDDAYWPDVVWGQEVTKRHDVERIEQLRQLLITSEQAIQE